MDGGDAQVTEIQMLYPRIRRNISTQILAILCNVRL